MDGLTRLSKLPRRLYGVDAVGHRVVHGGPKLRETTVIDDDVVEYLKTTVDLAPLHQPPAIAGIDREGRFPRCRAGCVFRYCISSNAVGGGIDVRASGRNGTNVGNCVGMDSRAVPAYAFEAGAQLAGVPAAESRILTAHLGAGASLCAIRDGKSVATHNDGVHPLEGLVMVTRSGTVDPGLMLWLLEHADLTREELSDAMEHASGLAGLSGTSGDVRDVVAGWTQVTRRTHGVEVFNHQLARRLRFTR